MSFRKIWDSIFFKKNHVAFPGTYHQLYLCARQRTLKWDLSLKRQTFSKVSYLSTDKEAEDCVKVLSEFYQKNGINIKASIAQCWRINILVKPVLEEHFNVPLVLTFGSIETWPGNIRYNMSEEDTRNLITSFDHTTTSLNLHAWLTLPSMEILDVTFLTSYGAINKISGLEGGIVYGPPENLNQKNYIYRPMVLGENFVEAAGLNNTYFVLR